MKAKTVVMHKAKQMESLKTRAGFHLGGGGGGHWPPLATVSPPPRKFVV